MLIKPMTRQMMQQVKCLLNFLSTVSVFEILSDSISPPP